MKIYFVLIFITLTVIACTEQKNKEIERTVNSKSVLGPSDNAIEKFIEAVKPERENLAKAIATGLPELYESYKADCQEVSKIIDTAVLQTALADMTKKYKDPFQKIYIESGIKKIFDEKFRKWGEDVKLKHEEWTEGDLGTMHGTVHTPPSTPTVPMDSSAQKIFSDFDFFETNGTCPSPLTQAGTTNKTFNTGVDLRLLQGASFFYNSCDAFAGAGKTINLRVGFRKITIGFSGRGGGTVFAMGWFGAAYSETSCGIALKQAAEIADRELFKLYALAPLMWFSQNLGESFNTYMNRDVVSYDRGGSSATEFNLMAYSKSHAFGSIGARSFCRSSFDFITDPSSNINGHIIIKPCLNIQMGN